MAKSTGGTGGGSRGGAGSGGGGGGKFITDANGRRVGLSNSVEGNFGTTSTRLSKGDLSGDSVIVRPAGVPQNNALEVSLPKVRGQVEIGNEDFRGTMRIDRVGNNSYQTRYSRDGLAQDGGRFGINRTQLANEIGQFVGGPVFNGGR